MELWQMDVVSFRLADATVVSLLTCVDDHSRFCVCAGVMQRADARSVCTAFSAALARHGVPDQLLTDNGRVFTGRLTRPHPAVVLFDRICQASSSRAGNEPGTALRTPGSLPPPCHLCPRRRTASEPARNKAPAAPAATLGPACPSADAAPASGTVTVMPFVPDVGPGVGVLQAVWLAAVAVVKPIAETIPIPPAAIVRKQTTLATFALAPRRDVAAVREPRRR
jgi:hypothetical protein